jgi:FkbM family methyltransferase
MTDREGAASAGTSPLRRAAAPLVKGLRRQIAAGVDQSEAVRQQAALLARLTAVEQRLEELLLSVGASMQHAVAAQEARLNAIAERVLGTAIHVEALAHAFGAGGRAVPLGEDLLVRTPSGWLLQPAEDLALLVGLLETGGRHEPGACHVIRAILSPGDLAVDAGAHVGIVTLVMAGLVRNGGHVLAVEPNPRLAALLRRTAVLNNLGGVVSVEACALGAAPGRATLTFAETTMSSSLLPLAGAGTGVEVPVRTLDSLLPEGSTPALVKLDVEGAELDAWSGMRGLLASSPNLAVTVEFGPSHLRRAGVAIGDWLAAFTREGFVPWVIEEPTGTISPLRRSGLENVFSLNLLMLRQPPGHWPRLRVDVG